MSVISEIKCNKCDRMYSGVRSKCPYCGTRRISKGKYAEDGDNSTGKILIAILIMTVFVVATGVLLFTTEVDDIPDPSLSDNDFEDDPELDPGYVSLPTFDPVEPVTLPFASTFSKHKNSVTITSSNETSLFISNIALS